MPSSWPPCPARRNPRRAGTSHENKNAHRPHRPCAFFISPAWHRHSYLSVPELRSGACRAIFSPDTAIERRVRCRWPHASMGVRWLATAFQNTTSLNIYPGRRTGTDRAARPTANLNSRNATRLGSQVKPRPNFVRVAFFSAAMFRKSGGEPPHSHRRLRGRASCAPQNECSRARSRR
jgi:hypothetical protein